jgi:hypothetical protein
MSNEFIGWEVQLDDNRILREGQVEWKDVPKKAVIRLSLFHYNGRQWDLSGKEAYFVKTRASMAPGVKESFRVERRTIGYYEGATKICYHVDEQTGKFDIEVIDTNNE